MARTIVGCGVVRRVKIQNFKVFARKIKRHKPLPTPPQNEEFCIKWHIIENLSYCGGVGACAASFFEQRLFNFGIRPS